MIHCMYVGWVGCESWFPLVLSLCGGSHGCVCMLGGVVLLVCCLVLSTCVVCLMALCFSLGHVVDIMLFTILLSWALCCMMLSCIVVFSSWWMTLVWVCRLHVICVVSLCCAPSFCCLALLFFDFMLSLLLTLWHRAYMWVMHNIVWSWSFVVIGRTPSTHVMSCFCCCCVVSKFIKSIQELWLCARGCLSF